MPHHCVPVIIRALACVAALVAAGPLAADTRSDVLKALEAGRVQQARACLERAAPRLARTDALALEALTDIRAGRLGSAEAALEAELARGRDRSPELLLLLGWLRLAAGDAQDAVTPLTEAARLSRAWPIDAALGQAWLELGNHEKAIEVLGRAAEGCPDPRALAAIFHDLAIANVHEGDLEEARRLLAQVAATTASDSVPGRRAARLLTALSPLERELADGSREVR